MLRAYEDRTFSYDRVSNDELELYIKNSIVCSDPSVIKKVVENWLSFNGSVLEFDELVCLTDFINNEEYMKKTLIVSDFSYRNMYCCLSLEFKHVNGTSYNQLRGGIVNVIKKLETDGFENFFLLVDNWQLYARGSITNEEMDKLRLEDEEESWLYDLL